MKLLLTPEQKQVLETQHAQTRDGRIRDRIKAVLLASEGWTPAMISQALRIHESTVRNHLADYTLEQYGVQYTVAGMHKWLRKNGFSYKKPKGVPHKFDTAKQQAFVEAYEALKAHCGEDERILFMDAVHPTQATKISHGWIRTGQDKAIETTGSRTRLNLIGALELNNIASAVVNEYEWVNSESIVQFFGQLRDKYPQTQKLHLILDGAGYHRAAIVKNAAISHNIELHYLPPYSPNLNPIERLWKVMNEHARNSVYFKNKRDFRSALDKFFKETLPDIGESLASRINDNFQLFTHASSG
ncbi:IS630 family transposase [Shewanella sp. SM78]|uniref:IS630 family transposase n=1 Tax=Shewanella sp. SM78 TaxID=2912810 RepID=UPI0021D9FA7B|nr:IS630 family transposase [Shewanella sp. SM78]MCU8020954.1 IS630 family transposase [Shewanella sp. SM78]